jgi:hypothetical protein
VRDVSSSSSIFKTYPVPSASSKQCHPQYLQPTDSILRMATDIQFLQHIQNNITHNSLELTWNELGNVAGIDLEYAWNMPGIYLE